MYGEKDFDLSPKRGDDDGNFNESGDDSKKFHDQNADEKRSDEILCEGIRKKEKDDEGTSNESDNSEILNIDDLDVISFASKRNKEKGIREYISKLIDSSDESEYRFEIRASGNILLVKNNGRMLSLFYNAEKGDKKPFLTDFGGRRNFCDNESIVSCSFRELWEETHSLFGLMPANQSFTKKLELPHRLVGSQRRTFSSFLLPLIEWPKIHCYEYTKYRTFCRLSWLKLSSIFMNLRNDLKQFVRNRRYLFFDFYSLSLINKFGSVLDCECKRCHRKMKLTHPRLNVESEMLTLSHTLDDINRQVDKQANVKASEDNPYIHYSHDDIGAYSDNDNGSDILSTYLGENYYVLENEQLLKRYLYFHVEGILVRLYGYVLDPSNFVVFKEGSSLEHVKSSSQTLMLFLRSSLFRYELEHMRFRSPCYAACFLSATKEWQNSSCILISDSPVFRAVERLCYTEKKTFIRMRIDVDSSEVRFVLFEMKDSIEKHLEWDLREICAEQIGKMEIGMMFVESICVTPEGVRFGPEEDRDLFAWNFLISVSKMPPTTCVVTMVDDLQVIEDLFFLDFWKAAMVKGKKKDAKRKENIHEQKKAKSDLFRKWECTDKDEQECTDKDEQECTDKDEQELEDVSIEVGRRIYDEMEKINSAMMRVPAFKSIAKKICKNEDILLSYILTPTKKININKRTYEYKDGRKIRMKKIIN